MKLKCKLRTLGSLTWLSFRNIYTNLWTGPHNSKLLLCSVLKNLSNIKNPILQKNNTLHAEKAESYLSKLCFVFHQEKLEDFFHLWHSIKGDFFFFFPFVAETIRSWRPETFYYIHPGLPLQDGSLWAVVEHSPRERMQERMGGLQGLPVSLCKNQATAVIISVAWDYQGKL